MPKFRAGALDKGSRTHGRYVVVEAASEADAVMEARRLLPGGSAVPLPRYFAMPAGPHDKVDHTVHAFTFPKKRDARGAQ